MDAELAALLAEARAPISERIAYEPPADPLPGAAFPAVVAHARQATADDRDRRWSRQVLGEDADEREVEALAARRAVTLAVNEVMIARPEACFATPFTGDGLATIHERPCVLAGVHSGICHGTWFGAARECGGRMFMNDGNPKKAPKRVLGPRAAALRVEGERAGIRWVGPVRRLDVMTALLAEGERCLLAVDGWGSGAGTLFGRDVLTTTGAAVLALRSGAPIVVVAGWYDATGFGARAAAPLDPFRLRSVEALHAAMLRTIEELAEDPAQLDLSRFPAVEVVRELQARRARS